MLKIRLQRVGRKHEPSFRLVLTDSKNSTKSGRFGEILGSYDPRKSTEALKADRIKHWIAQGVGLTATVNNLLIKKGVIRGKKINVSKGVRVPDPVVEAAPIVETVAPDTSIPEEVSVSAPVEESPVIEEVVEAPTETKSDTIESVPTE